MSEFYVVTPHRNYRRFLPDAIAGVRAQGVDALLHVQDACSDDGSLDLLRSQAAPDLSVTSEADRGQCDAVNRALARAPSTARYVGWLNADDFYLPGALAAVRQEFERHPAVDVVYGDAVRVDEQAQLLRLVAVHGLSRPVLRSLPHLYVYSSSTFFRRRVLDDGALRLDEAFRQTMDLELFVRLDASGYRFRHLPRPLSCFRVHGEQLSTAHGSAVESAERRAVEERFGYRSHPGAARVLHRARKATTGAYLREARALRYRGRSLRWFDDPTAAALCATWAGAG